MSRAATAARRARRPRPGALEREARRAGSAAPGAKGLARGLSRTAAAPRQELSGPGKPLPDTDRREAESAFGADFSAVRLHGGVAGLAGAGAGAAGADILLAGPALPGNGAGRSLLFHELAHVLQQTGRAGPDGRLQARRLHGSGPIHAQGGTLPGANAPASDAVLPHLIWLHRRGRSDTDLETADPDLSDVIALVETRFAGGYELMGRSAAGDALQTEVVANSVPELDKPVTQLSRDARGLLYDVLKFAGHYEGALYLLDHCCRLETALYWPDFHKAIAAKLPDIDLWAAPVLDRDAGLRAFLTRVMPETYWNYLIDPDRSVQSLYNFKERAAKFDKSASDWSVLGENERVAAAILLIQKIDQGRLDHLKEEEAKSKKVGLTGSTLKLGMAMKVSRFVEAKRKKSGFPPNVYRYLEATAALAQRAEHYWTSVFAQLGKHQETLSRHAALTPDLRAELLLKLPEVPAVAELRTKLAGEAGKLLALEADKGFPSRSTYTRRVATFAKAVRGRQGPLTEVLRKGLPRTAEPGSEAGFVGLGVVLRVIELLLTRLDQYDPGADRRMESENGAADVRIHHRLLVARHLYDFSLLLGAGQLEASASAVLTGADRARSTLILLSDWEEQNLRFDKIHKDFPDLRNQERPFVHFTPGGSEAVQLPIAFELFVRFYHLVHDRTLANALRDLLASTPTDFDPERKPILVQGYDKAAAADLPRRWHVENWDLVRFRDDKRTFSQLVADHPKTGKQLLPERKPLGTLIGSKEYRAEVFAWNFPSANALIAELKKIVELNALIGPDPATAAALPDADWLRGFVQLAETEDLTELDAIVRKRLTERRAVEKGRLETLIPAAVTHERLSITPVLREALRAYAEDNIRHYGKPIDALELIRKFSRFVRPEKDSDVQTAALLAALAPDIRKAFSAEGLFGAELNETRFDIITGYFGLLKMAARMTTAQEWPAVQRVLRADEAIDRDAANQHLDHLIQRFQEQAARVAERNSLRTDGLTGLRSTYSNISVNVGEPFQAGGNSWSIVKVHQEFIYLPAYGQGDAQVRPPTLLSKDREPMAASGKALLTIRVGSGEIDITDDLTGRNRTWLDELTRVVAGRSIQLSFQNSSAVIEAFRDVIVDLVECVPGAGQAVMAARIAAQVAHFFASGQYQEIAALVRGDPVQLLREVVEKLNADFLKPDPIWEYMLFDSAPLERLKKKGEENEARGQRSRHRKGKLGRVIRTISRVGLTVHEKINAVKLRLEPRVRAVQAFVQGRPPVAAAVDFASLLAISPAFPLPPELKGALSGGVDEDKLGDRLSELVQSINDFELPRDLIDNAVVIDAILELIIDIVARGCVGLVVETILDGSGLREDIASQIASSLNGTGADPNVIWRNEFREPLGKAIDGAKTEFVDSVIRVLGPFGLGDFAPPPATDLGQGDFLELQPHGGAPAAGPPPGVTLGEGRPLPPALRRSVERGFGHDFGHVRLHGDGAARALTRHYGADALTSGSHVLLAPGLDPDRGSGRRILHHELGHVLQQTGSRPLGGRAPDRPVGGRPGRGLSLDRDAESEADRLAAAAGAPGHRVGAPLGVSTRGADGYAPALGGPTFARILQKFLEAKEITEFREDVERQATTTVAADHLRDSERTWEGTWQALRANARTGKGFAGNTGDKEIPDTIRDYLTEAGTDRPRGQVEKALAALTRRAEKIKGKPPNTHTEFNARLFANLLEGYVYARTGVSLNISLTRSGRFSSVKVLSVDLGRAGPTSALWTKARERTNSHIDARKLASPAQTQHWKRLDGRDWAKLGNMLRVGGPQAGAMHHKEFRVDDGFLEQFFQFLAQSVNARVPNWQDYTTTGTHERQGEPRLRVGTHKQLTQDVNIAGRESHHIPQFLLVQYFRNQAERPLFDNRRPRLPGFTPPGAAEPTAFSDGSHRIDLAGLHGGRKGDKGNRGLGMAAISLAATTHQTAGLHVGLSRTWNEELENTGTASQGNTIESEFQKRFIKATGQSDYEGAARWANEPKNEHSAGPRAVFTAISGTYDWMYQDVMRPALVKGLRVEEARYFATVATGQGGATDTFGALVSDYDPLQRLGRLDKVIAAVDALQSSNPISGFRG